ncbi:hypothetical protein LUZ63_011960 [Rhynchospora breviuscula]|uniref:Syntaxin N-terminal domain-containing protein n=1 Tax=Rhynchospora breviuscula TaxID=2022672 RepID=A0A9Q0HR20_9POAL|nr:hypothetical protein LUZ63_011960 [Rhynchospora breviuscula]
MGYQDLKAKRIKAPQRKRGGGAPSGQTMSQALADGIFQINTSVSTFQGLVNMLGTPKDTPDLRERLHKTGAYITDLVKDTSEKLKQASEADHRTQVHASKKIADAKYAKDFCAGLKQFQKAQRLAVEREPAYAPPISSSLLFCWHSLQKWFLKY